MDVLLLGKKISPRSMSVCMSVCMHVSMYACMHACMYVSVRYEKRNKIEHRKKNMFELAYVSNVSAQPKTGTIEVVQTSQR